MLVLLWTDHPKLLLNEECKTGKPRDPIAVKTKLDFVLMRDKKENSQMNSSNHIAKNILSEKLENFFASRHFWVSAKT